MCAGKVRIRHDRTLKRGVCKSCIRRCKAIEMTEANMVVRPRIQSLGSIQSRNAGLVEGNLDFERRKQMRYDPRSKIFYPFERGFEPISPEHFP